MPKKDIKNVGFRVALDVHDKLRYIAKYEGRSLNGQIYYLMQKCIREFEKEHGPITAKDIENAFSKGDS